MIEDDRGTVRAVVWSELFPWLILFRCFRISIGLRPLLLSAVAAAVTVLGWSLLGWLFSNNTEVARQHRAYNGCPWNAFAAVADDAGLAGGRVYQSEYVSNGTEDSIIHRNPDPILGTWEHLSRPFREVFTMNMGSQRLDASIFAAGHDASLPKPENTTLGERNKEFQAGKLAYSLLCALWALTVWAFAGGAVTRDAAVQLASGERIGWGGMIGYAKARWKAYAWGPLLPFLGVLFGVVIIALFGFILMCFNVGVFIAGILWPLILAGGFLMALLLLGLAFGWPLMFATISTEGTDSFDALSRSYAYVFQRPLHYFFYTVVVTIVGLLGWVLVFGFVQSLIHLTQGAACWGSGGQFVFTLDPIPHIAYQFSGDVATSHLGWFGDLLIRTWNDCTRLLAVGYLYSYFWVSASGIYLLLRRDVDDTELDEVYLDFSGNEESLGLPEIGRDEAGAPVVNDIGHETPPETE